jgi:ABC-type uncharacterized transport system permease subunit
LSPRASGRLGIGSQRLTWLAFVPSGVLTGSDGLTPIAAILFAVARRRSARGSSSVSASSKR